MTLAPGATKRFRCADSVRWLNFGDSHGNTRDDPRANSMVSIKAEGTRYHYVPAGEAATIDLPLRMGPRSLLDGIDTRLVFLENPLSVVPKLFPCWLLWQSAADLQDLDRRVMLGEHNDGDFSWACLTYFNVTRCVCCESKFSSLVVDAGLPYLGAPGLLREKLGELKTIPCLSCGSPFRILVVRVFDEVRG